MSKIKNRIGEVRYNNAGLRMEIIEYNNCKDILVKFESGATVKAEHGQFKNGRCKDPLSKDVLNIGFYGIGNYSARKNGKMTKRYHTWFGMLSRCYNAYEVNKHLTYNDVYVCDEWLNYQNFAEWYEKNYYEFYGMEMQLDKDILFKGNKFYSPDKCCFVPQAINKLFTKTDKLRGDCPIGVFLNKKNSLFAACISIDKKSVHLGEFKTPKRAFMVYKKAKEDNIKRMADKFRQWIPANVYDSLYNYVVEITD